jgi:hypothetical protein
MMGRGIAWTALLVVPCGMPAMATPSSEIEPNDASGQATALGNPANGVRRSGSRRARAPSAVRPSTAACGRSTNAGDSSPSGTPTKDRRRDKPAKFTERV